MFLKDLHNFFRLYKVALKNTKPGFPSAKNTSSEPGEKWVNISEYTLYFYHKFTKRLYILEQPYSEKRQVRLSMYELFVDTRR